MTDQFKLFKGNGVLAGYADTIQEAMSICDRQHGWYFEKEENLTKEELHYKVVRLCVNKELEPFGITYDDVKKGGQYEICTYSEVVEKKKFFGLWKSVELVKKSKPWFQFFTFDTPKQYEAWKKFCINLFRKELKMTKAQAETEFGWFNLNCGLKQNYELDK